MASSASQIVDLSLNFKWTHRDLIRYHFVGGCESTSLRVNDVSSCQAHLTVPFGVVLFGN